MLTRRSLAAYALGGAALAAAAPDAPEFARADGWLNTTRPLTLAGLRGRVVLVEFCTYTCINWRRRTTRLSRAR